MSDQNPFEERIVRAVQAFMAAKTWPERKAIVQAHQDDLLTPAADQVFEGLLMQYKDDEKARRILEDLRSLLLRCQSEGVDAAFADRVQTQSIPDIPPELFARLMSIRSEEEFHELIEDHPELLPVIRQMAARIQASQKSPAAPSIPGELSALLQELQGLNHLSDMPRCIELCQAALRLVNPKAQPKIWAGLQVELANSLAQNPFGPRAENLELAINHYNQALEVLTHEAFPEDWAMTQNNLGNAYLNRIRGDRVENLELAINHYNQALEVRTLERFPADRRQTLRNLGNLHFNKQSWGTRWQIMMGPLRQAMQSWQRHTPRPAARQR